MIFLVWLINALILLGVAEIVPGFEFSSFFAALVAALIIGLINVTLRPILLLLTLPINLLTLGLFTVIINALLLMLVGEIVKGFLVVDFRAALLGSILIALGNWLANMLLAKGKEA